MLFESISKGPRSFLYVFIIARKVTALKPIYGPTFVDHGIFVLGGDQQVFDGTITFEVGLYTISPTDLFNVFAETLGIGYYYMTLSFNFIGNGLGAHGALSVGLIINLTGWPSKPFLHLVQSPFGVFTMGKYFPEVFHFLLEKIRIATNSFGPMGKSVNYTVFR